MQRSWMVGAAKTYSHDPSGKLSAPGRHALIAALRKRLELPIKP